MNKSNNIFLSDEQLFRQLQKGDKDAYTVIYHKYHKLLYSLTYRYLLDRNKTEDIVQYVFVRLWEFHSSLDIKINLKNFLFTMTKNNILNYIRDENSALEKNYEIVQLRSEFDDDLVEKLEKKELMDILYHIMEKLPTQKREICKLKLDEELTNPEIAEKLNLSVNTIKTHYSESLKILRLELKKILINVILAILISRFGV